MDGRIVIKALILQGSLDSIRLIWSVRVQADGLQHFVGLGIKVLHPNEFPCNVMEMLRLKS